MIQYADPVIDSNFSKTPVVDLPPGSLVGTWVFQGVSRDSGSFLDPVGPRTWEGTFQAHRGPLRRGHSWRLELTENDNPGRPLLPEKVSRRRDSSQLDLNFGGPSAVSRLREVEKTEHKELMAVLRYRLEERYGQAEELNVLFHDTQPVSLPWQLDGLLPWWRRIWRRR